MEKRKVSHERSAGVILFHEEPRQYLLLHKARSPEFPKGHVEKGETDRQAALREAFEETGIRAIDLVPGFRHRIRFSFRSGEDRSIVKSVSYFLGSTAESVVTLSKEHKKYEWLPPEQAMARLRFKNQRMLIQKAEEFLQRRAGRSARRPG